MPLPVISNVYRCAFNWVHDDFPVNATNVMHFKKSSSNPAAVAAIIFSNLTADMWRVQDTHAHIHDVTVTPLDGSSVSLPVVTGSTTSFTGQQTTHEIVPQVSNVIKMLTAKRGRSYRGHAFLPWVVESVMSGGLLEVTNQAAITAAWVAFLAAMDGDSCPLEIASYKLATSDPVIAIGCERYTATQRRRLKRNSLV